MRKPIFFIIVFLSPILLIGQIKDLPKFEFGLKLNSEFYPGNRIIPVKGPDIMKSIPILGWSSGISFQFNSKRNFSLSLNAIYAIVSPYRSLTYDYDYLFYLDPNMVTTSLKELKLGFVDDNIFLNLSLKKFIGEKPIYVIVGGGLYWSPYGFSTTGLFAERYDEFNNTYVMSNLGEYVHYQGLWKATYKTIEFGVGCRKNTRLLNFDYKLSFIYNTPYYMGHYNFNNSNGIHAEGFFVQKNYMLQTGISFYLKSLKRIKNEK